jgi:hypothetical protein
MSLITEDLHGFWELDLKFAHNIACWDWPVLKMLWWSFAMTNLRRLMAFMIFPVVALCMTYWTSILQLSYAFCSSKGSNLQEFSAIMLLNMWLWGLSIVIDSKLASSVKAVELLCKPYIGMLEPLILLWQVLLCSLYFLWGGEQRCSSYVGSTIRSL